jgi:hypothetical protein
MTWLDRPGQVLRASVSADTSDGLRGGAPSFVSWFLLVNLPLELARRGAVSCTLRRRRVCRRSSCSGVRVAFGEFVGSRNRQVAQQAGLDGVSRLER